MSCVQMVSTANCENLVINLNKSRTDRHWILFTAIKGAGPLWLKCANGYTDGEERLGTRSCGCPQGSEEAESVYLFYPYWTTSLHLWSFQGLMNYGCQIMNNTYKWDNNGNYTTQNT